VIRQGGIIAAGEGSRLRRDGFSMPKPLVRVAGIPLVEHVIGHFLAAGIETLAVIFNEDEEDCVDFVRSRFGNLDLRIVVKTTASSLESFGEVAALLGGGRALISTVDAFCGRPSFVDFVRGALGRPAEASVLAVTPFVADERPLWVDLDPSGRVSALGGPSGALVTAGMYMISDRVRLLAPELARSGTLGRLRDFLVWLHRQGEPRFPLFGETIQTVIDVDRAEDVALAEALVGGAPEAVS
jgi:NDP-sugar pyrophosphorylase family protein